MSIYNFSVDDAIRFGQEQGIQTFQRGNELHFKICPYCHGSNGKDKKTFAINLETGTFNCFRSSCGAHGNMITLSRDFNFSLGTTVDEYYNSQRQYRQFRRKEKPKPKAPAVAYLEGRGISAAVTERYHITVQKEHDNILVFPFYDERDELQFVKYRKTDFDREHDRNKEWCEKDCKPILFGMSQCNLENKTLILTEGQIDSLSVSEAGIENAVSVPTGAKGFTWVPYCWDFLKRFETLIVFGDYEKDHITLLDEMKMRFTGCVKHVRPEDYRGCKDANDILRKYGKDAIRAAIKNAVPIENPKIIPLEKVQRVELSKMERFSTGIYQLDRLLGGFYFGQLIALTGERGEGKSTLASQFGTFAIKAGYPVFFYSGELMNWHFRAWFEYQVAGSRNINPMQSNFGYTSYTVHGDVLPAIEVWYSGKAYIYDNSIVGDGNEEEALVETMETAIKQYGCRVLIVDNLMTAIEDDITTDLYRNQSNFVKQLARMAKSYNVLIIFIVHPRKSNGYKFDNDSVAGSSNITNLVDVTMRYSRPDDDKSDGDTSERRLYVYKNRLTGKTDRKGIPLYFQESSKRISEHDGIFDWELGWEDRKLPEFVPEEDIVFD